MSGSCAGIHALLSREIPQAIYTHCMIYKLNLIIVMATCRGIKSATGFFITLQGLYVFMSESAVHQIFIDTQVKIKIENLELKSQVTPNGPISSFMFGCEADNWSYYCNTSNIPERKSYMTFRSVRIQYRGEFFSYFYFMPIHVCWKIASHYLTSSRAKIMILLSIWLKLQGSFQPNAWISYISLLCGKKI